MTISYDRSLFNLSNEDLNTEVCV